MHTLIKPILITTLLLQSITYANTQEIYLGVHQAYGILKDTLIKNHQISGNRSGLSEKSVFDMLAFHYQHSKEWGITAILSSKFAPLDTQQCYYDSSLANIVAKKKLFQQGRSHIYFPVGIWGAASEATPKADNNQKPHYIAGGGVVLGGLGFQLSFNYILIDVAYERLWSFSRIEHTNLVTINLEVKLLSFSKK